MDAYERIVVEPVLLVFQQVLGEKPSPDAEEKEFIVDLLNGWKNARTETQVNAVLTVLRVRGIRVPDAARERMLAQKDLALLERWLERAIVATSVGDVIDDPT